MKDNKTKSLIMMICGGLLIAWSAFSFLLGSIKWISAWIKVGYYIPFSNFFHFVPTIVFVALGVLFLLKKKDWITVGLVGLLYLVDVWGFLKLIPYIFQWSIGDSLPRILINLLACTASLSLLAVIVLVMLWPKNVISKFLWILSPVAYFMSVLVSLLSNIIRGWFSAQMLGSIFEGLIYCIVLAALGFVLQLQFDEPTTHSEEEIIPSEESITINENNEISL